MWPGRNWPLGATWGEESHELRGATPPRRPAVWLCLFDDDGTETRHELTEQTPGHLARRAARRERRPALRLPGRRAVGAEPRPAVQPAQAAARPLRPRGQRRVAATGDLRPRPRRRSVTTTATRRRTSPAAWSCTTTSTGATTAKLGRRWRDTVDLRAAREGLHRAARPDPRAPARARTPASAHPAVTDYLRDLGVTAVELLPVQQFASEPGAGRARPDQLLGLQHDRLLRPARGVLLLGRPRPAGHASSSRW